MASLKHPFTMVIAGPTGCGKTMWLKQLINGRLKFILPPPTDVIYFFAENQPIFNKMKRVKFVEGLDITLIDQLKGKRTLVIIDDLMDEAANSVKVSSLFTKGSHHRNISVILVVQNMFVKGKEMRNISLNAQYIVLFKNPRDKTIAFHIARQMYPGKVSAFQQVFEDATSDAFSYLFIDLTPATPEERRLLTDIFVNPSAYII